ncbi:MAG: CsgG/HfaB family protein [Brevinematales bacterium]|nr:CsgG/HfaB family protein [Brevinematales bacterium]
MRLKILALIILLFSISFSQTNDYVKVAVLDISAKIEIKDIDRNFLTERLQIELLKYRGLKVVERLELKRIMDEQKIQLSGLSEKDAIKIGGISGANKIIIGSLTEVEDSYFLIIKVIDTSTSEIDFIDQVSGENTIELSKQINIVASKIAKALLKLPIEKPAKINEEKNTEKEEKSYSSSEISEKFWMPLAISFVKPFQLPGEDYNIYGGAISLVSGKYNKVFGLHTGIININENIYGAHIGIINTTYQSSFGIKIGIVNNAYGIAFGPQIGVVNKADTITGIQLGIVNIAEKMMGIQVGVVNINRSGAIPYMFGINIGF